MKQRLTVNLVSLVVLLLLLGVAGCASTQNGAEMVGTPATEESDEADTTDDTAEGDEAEEAEDAAEDAAEGDDTAEEDADAPDAAAVGDAPPDDTMVYRLDDKAVTVGDYRERLERDIGPPIAQFLAQGQTPEQVEQLAIQQDVRNRVLENMIREDLLVKLAREEGVGVDTDAVDEQVELQMSQPQPPAMDGAEPEPTPSEAELRETITQQQLVQQMITSHTTADMHLSRHILVTDTVTAEEISATLKSGDATFEELASEFSQDPGSKDTGGTYGWIPRGQFVPEYDEAAFNAELNEPVIVESQFGYHIIVVEDREEDRTFEDPETLFSSPNFQQYLDESFLPWYEEQQAEAIENETLEINEEFEPRSIPLPFPEGSEPGSGGGDADGVEGVPAPAPVEVTPVAPPDADDTGGDAEDLPETEEMTETEE